MVKKYECDICKKLINWKDIFFLEFAELDNEDNVGSYVFIGEICRKCGGNILKLFKNKVDIHKDWKGEFKQNLKKEVKPN